jgi:NDP-sugar pyrophosphorylase family protein
LVRAKPAVPIAGAPLVGRIVRWLAGQEIRQLVLNLHYLPETITAQIGDGGGLGAQVRYSWEFPVLGSAGGPRKALPLLPPDDFFVINGDTLTDIDLSGLASQHRHTGALVTLAVMENRWQGRYGGVITDSQGVVHGFVPRGPAAPGYHFIGVQLVHPSAFAGLPPDTFAESNSGIYRTLIAERPGSVRAFLCEGAFWDVGTPRDYLEAALSIGRSEGHPSPQIGSGCQVSTTARVLDSVLWDHVVVGAGASIERCVVADGVTIPPGVSFRNCAIIQGERDLIVADMANES